MKSRKLIAFLCAAAIGITAAPYIASETINGSMVSALAAENVMTITKQGGALECAYVEWQSSAQTSGYTVTYKAAGTSEEITVDKQLVRRYSDRYRVDIPGLKAGSYVITIKDGSGNTVTADDIAVSAHTREGFAFSKASPNGGNASGGYNEDGTVPADAKILYITQDNVNTVSMTIGKKTYTGLGNILNGISNASSPDSPNGHYIIRILGTLNGDSISFEDGNSDAARHLFYLQEISNLTVEGIGDDATLYRCSFLVKGSSNVEVRNLGIMLYLDDGIAIENSNSNIWIHNNDIFYGSPGADSDQVKGDGALDIKGDSTYCTLSYNHFWDNGKSSLVISSGKNINDTTSNLSYHHNWFDHSDSRHPRIRFATVHMYNNYFDGNAKYGTGVTSGASAFVEANYFRACKHPMMSSMQGSDTAGTFSKEAGGIIKAYNNTMVDCGETIYYSSGSDFDAYLAKTREEQVPAAVVTKQNTYSGLSSHTYNDKYNNFDTASTMYSYTPDVPEDVPEKVTANAGRLDGGDFKWSFSGSKDDESADIDSDLKTALINYKPTVVQLYSGAAGELYPATNGSAPVITAAPATSTPKPTTAPTPMASPSVTGAPANPTATPSAAPTTPPESELTPVTAKTAWSFEDAASEYNEPAVYKNMKIYSSSSKAVTLTDSKYTEGAKALKLPGAATPGKQSCVSILTGAAGKLTILFENTSSSSTRTMQVWGGLSDDDIIGGKDALGSGAEFTVDVPAGKEIYIGSKSNGLSLISVVFEPTSAPTVTASPEPTTAPTPTAKPTEAPTPTVKPTEAPTPTAKPTEAPTPTVKPTEAPTPTAQPTEAPTPTAQPEKNPYTVELTAANGIITAEVQGETASETNVCGFIAQYNAEGRLIGIKSMTWNGGNSTLTADTVQGAVSAKGFVWNVSYEPISEVEKADIK